MAPLQKKTIQHFTHPKHSLTIFDSNTKYLCDGCKIPGTGKRYHCHECEFDLHEYCGTCPMSLSSFLHPYHSLKLVNRTPHDHRQFDRVCNVCCDSVEGLFYRCDLCEFNVHPLCTQLAQTVRHVLHQEHPLRLLGPSEQGTCAVCRGACNASSWRYRCALCKFDIHMECVLVHCEKKRTWLGISKYVPPSVFPTTQYFEGHAYEIPYWNPNHNGMPHLHPYPQYQWHSPVQTHQGGSGRRIGKIMFVLVKIVTTVVMLGLL